MLLLLLLSRFSRVRLCATPQMAAHQPPPSLGSSRQEHWSGLPLPSPTTPPLPVSISPQMWPTCFPLDSRLVHSVVPIVSFVCNFFRSGYPVGFYLLRQAVLIMNFPSNHRPLFSYLSFFCILLYPISLSTIINILDGTFYMSASFRLTLDSLRQRLSFSGSQVPGMQQVAVAQHLCGTA